MSRFQHFPSDISSIELPQKFTFPFYYEPHPLVLRAAELFQKQLSQQPPLEVGKMFGVLVVKNGKGQIGYLAAASGKLPHDGLNEVLVPPVYNVHDIDSFYAKGESELNAMNRQIEQLERDAKYIFLQKKVAAEQQSIEDRLKSERKKLKHTKNDRKKRREEAEASMNPEAFEAFNKTLAEESVKGQFLYKRLAKELRAELTKHQKELDVLAEEIALLKQQRKRKSADLQQRIFDQFQFVNKDKNRKGLTEIFPNFKEQKPPSGAGECSAPKLLQYAFLNDLTPIAMGEFWWGPSPKTEVRKHQHFYPACNGRCKPILAHMLEGIEMEENPFLKNPAEGKDISIVFEDDALIIVNKPADFLSVPGKEIKDSVYARVKARYPDATGPLVVHRLDMSTSGILVLTKTKEANKVMQRQFAQRTVKKRYVALLDGQVDEEEGYIDLPLRVDLDDRPRQMVCNEYGKPAKTKWKVSERIGDKTRVHLYPITGRTHQLRVHAAHPLGLNTPITGDDLYGQRADRLYLHAEFIEFVHPLSKEKMNFTIKAEF